MNRQIPRSTKHAPVSRLAMCLLLCSAIATLVLSSPARAATIAITPSYVQSFGEGMTPLGVLPDGGAATPVGGLLHYEFRMSIDELLTGEDFWTAIFNVNLGPGLEAVTAWMDPGTAQANDLYSPPSPSLANYDSNGSTLGGVKPHWQYGNGDFGLDSNDLKSIIVEAAPDEAANRQYGELVRPAAGSQDALGSPTLIGAILVRRTELVLTSVSVSPIAGSPWGTYQNNLLGQGVPIPQAGSSFSGGSAVLAVVPEPSTLALVLGGLATLFFVRSRKISRAQKTRRHFTFNGLRRGRSLAWARTLTAASQRTSGEADCCVGSTRGTHTHEPEHTH